ncbi:MAG: transporter substrate-binding domain-containing protein [Clostridia bacterium]|nr:transporter substrate-binding domain-containing protein [Clostridia bacterium]
MKKKIIITVLTVLLLSILSVTAFAFTTGDVTGDGKLTAADARLALRYSAKLETLTDEQIKAADVDNSGKVTASDARKILRVCAKLDPPFEGIDISGYLIEEGVLHVAIPVDNKPFAYEENGKLKGIDISIFEGVAQYCELELVYHPMAYEDMVDAVNNGECDVAATLSSAPVIKYTSVIRNYYDDNLYMLINTESAYDSYDKIVNSSAKVGVLADTIDKYTVEKKLPADCVVAYKTCREASKDLRDKKIAAFITNSGYAFNIAMEFGELEVLSDPSFNNERHCIITAQDKGEFSKKLGMILTESLCSESVDEYNCLKKNSSLSLKKSSITLAPGGSACLEITQNSFFFDYPSVFFDNNSFQLNVMYTKGKQFLVITTTENSYSESIKLSIPNETASFTLDIKVDPKAPKNIVLDDNLKVPDFGAYMKTKVYEASIDEQTAVFAMVYTAEDLYNSGVTDTAMFEPFFNDLEKAGFKYEGYMEHDNTIIAMYYNEAAGKAFSYVEVFDSYGYIQEIGVGFNLMEMPV